MFEYADFHPDCDVTVVASGGRVYIVCPKCRVIADLEAIGTKITESEGFAARLPGKSYTMKQGTQRSKFAPRSQGG